MNDELRPYAASRQDGRWWGVNTITSERFGPFANEEQALRAVRMRAEARQQTGCARSLLL